MFEHHDRTRFETYAVSFGRRSCDALSARLRAGFEHFIEAQDMSDLEIGNVLRDQEIDIAVDLNGYTDGARPGLFVRRPTPIQVNYLGFAGTLARASCDYIIADRFVIPERTRNDYSEKVVYLPDTFMATDGSRQISAHTPSRAEMGLPSDAFVFCCFNAAYKITPDMFDIWMRLLSMVEGSVLWLAGANERASSNLRREAETRGISGSRLVFAARTPSGEDHLARLRLADLFLDTRYYNAHATAADALWAGVPLVTCAGSTFASRVAGSLLRAVGLTELVTESLADYQALALKLARDAATLASIRVRLARNRTLLPLFNTERFTRHLEAAYMTMWERYRRGEAVESFALAPLDGVPAAGGM